MKLIEAANKSGIYYTSEENYELVAELIKFFKLKADLEIIDTQEVSNNELLIIMGGEGDEDFEIALELGLELNSTGDGFIYLKSAKFLFSFMQYVLVDQGNKSLISARVFIPFKPAFDQLRTAYDYFLTQEGRVTKGLDRKKYIDQLSRHGITDVEVNGLGYPMALENGLKGETYPMFYTYCPAMDQFVYSSLNKGVYPFYYLSQNLQYLKQNARWAVDRGLKPGMLSFEPRSVPESFFARYPMLRGARVDHPFRSFMPRYNMTITHPLVLNHYWEMTQKLLLEVPELSYFTIWTNDSGAGFEHTKSLYVGRNGGAYLIREWKDDAEISRMAGENALRFMRNILEAGREINPDFRVITRLESFYGEHDIIWKGLGDGLDIETSSLVAKGWEMPYKHIRYPDSEVLNGGGLHHQSLLPEESTKYKELAQKDSKASFYLGMGPEVMFAPLMGIPYPESVWNRLKGLEAADIRDLVVYGGTFPPEQVPYFINYEMIRRFQYESDADVHDVIAQVAERWAPKQSEVLINAWNLIEKTVVNFPNVSTLYNTIGFAWFRIWTRPLVPDLEAVSNSERAYYEDMMCTTPHNPNNVDLSKDVLFKIASLEHCRKSYPLIDNEVIPYLDEAINILKGPANNDIDSGSVFYDLYIRTQALKAYLITHRNVAVWITGVHGYLNTTDPILKEENRKLLDDMISKELANMDELYHLFDEDVDFIALMETGESPLMYGKDIQKHIRFKQELMEKYRHTEPNIDADYMMKKAGTIMQN